MDYRAMEARRADHGMWKLLTREPERTMELIATMGFGVVCNLGTVMLDHSLITTLVERWRPETHTFHLPVGEATITLQDIEVLMGLRVDGYAVATQYHHLN